MKKFLFIIVCVLAGIITGRAADGDKFEFNGLNYRIISESDREVAVTYSPNIYGDLTIPSTVNYNAHSYKVTLIDYDAFMDCIGLTSVTIPDGVRFIGINPFSRCENLAYISVDESNQYFCDIDGVLFNREASTLIAYPGGKTGHYIIPETANIIQSGAFSDCRYLMSVTIPQNVSIIESRNFSNCQSLEYFIVDEHNSDYSAIDGVLFDRGGSFGNKARRLLVYPAGGLGGDYVVPNSVEVISDYAFSDCKSLKSVTIPNSVSSIGVGTFAYCSGLTSVTLPNSVTSIGYGAFLYCSGLTSVTIPNSVTSIGEGAFSYCSGLTSVTIPSSVTRIGSEGNLSSNPFEYCSNLKEIMVEEDNKNYCTIDGVLFNKQATMLCIFPGGKGGDYTIPGTVTSTKNRSFIGCSLLTSVTIPNSVTIIEIETFYDCTGLTSMTIPNSVTAIGWSAFDGCSGLTSVSLPESIKAITLSTFRRCSNLSSVTIPSSVTYIDWYAFGDCTSMEKIISLNPEPPIASSSSFDGNPVWATVYVPKGSIPAYSMAEGWNYFSNFKEIEDSGIEEAIFDNSSCVEVFSLDGVCVGHSLDGLTPGIYIIRQASTVRKVSVK